MVVFLALARRLTRHVAVPIYVGFSALFLVIMGWTGVGVVRQQIMMHEVAATLPMLTPLILILGIASGLFTPTEAASASASVAVVYVLILGMLVYRTIPLSEVPQILIATARISGTILFIAATSQIAGWIFAYEGLPEKVATLLQGLHLGPTTGLLVIFVFVFLILVGIFMEAIPAMFILIPVLMPPVQALGIDPIHFLIVTVMTLTLGLVTPPIGSASSPRRAGPHGGADRRDHGAGSLPGPDPRPAPAARPLLTGRADAVGEPPAPALSSSADPAS